jgi:hypothetical protein
VHEVRGRSVLECRAVHVGADGPRVHHGRFVFRSVLLEALAAISDGPW